MEIQLTEEEYQLFMSYQENIRQIMSDEKVLIKKLESKIENKKEYEQYVEKIDKFREISDFYCKQRDVFVQEILKKYRGV